MLPRDHDGVTYVANAAAPGLKFFTCAAYRSTMSQQGCGRRWVKSQTVYGEVLEAFEACRGCEIGSAHAGQEFIRYSRPYETRICPRCRRGSARMIHGTRCVSCYNREAEVAKGRNARGNDPMADTDREWTPRKLGEAKPWRPNKEPLAKFSMLVTGDGPPRLVEAEAVDRVEVILRTLRNNKGNLAFAPVPRPAVHRQLALAI